MAVLPTSDSTTVSLENGIQLEDFVHIDPDKTRPEVQISNQCLDNSLDDLYDRGPCVKCMELVEGKLGQVYASCQPLVHRGYKVVLLILYLAYFTYCMYYRFGDEGSIVLLVGTVMFLTYLCRKLFLSQGYTCNMSRTLASILASSSGRRSRLIIRYGLYMLTTAGIFVFLGMDVLKYNPENCQSLIGIAAIILICFFLSKKPSRINWHPVFWGFAIQFVFAILTLRTDFGYRAFKWVGDVVQTLVEFSDTGSEFVLGKNFRTMGLAFSLVGVIVFFNCIIVLLTHWGVMEVIVIRLGAFIGFCLETEPVESVNAVANIFMGFTEVGLFIRPYVPILSRSELCAVMTAGFASVSGGILGVFIKFGAPANHLLTAAVISAPAALALAKVIYPETERVNVALQKNMKLRDESESRSALSVCADGALMALKICAPIMANMMAFVSLLNMLNSTLGWFGRRAGIQGLTFDIICSYLLYPLSYAMGAVPEDCGKVGALIGIKLFATPMVGYAELGKIIQNRRILETYVRTGNVTWHWSGADIVLDALNTTLINGVMSERSEVITTYAMCGFSAFTAIGICIGSFTSMCPSRKQDIVQLVMISFFVGNMASFATGAIAGVMFTQQNVQHS